MKKFLCNLLVMLLLQTTGYSQTTLKQTWEGLLNKKELADFFKGTFERLGVYIDSTNEAFTVVHAGDHFLLEEGVDSGKVDYIIQLKPENMRNMLRHGEDSKIDEAEAYKIMSVLFTPLTQSGLSNPRMNNKGLLKAIGIEDHLHVYLYSPDRSESTTHTIVFVNDQWLLIPGIVGKAQRTFVMMPKDAIEYQKELFAAQKNNTKASWKAFAKWFKQWKNKVSTKNK